MYQFTHSKVWLQCFRTPARPYTSCSIRPALAIHLVDPLLIHLLLCFDDGPGTRLFVRAYEIPTIDYLLFPHHASNGERLALTRMMLCFLGWMSLMSFIAVYPEIFLMHATLLLLIYGVVFSTSTNYDYPPLARNVGWLGFTIVLITMLLLAAGAPIRTIAHLFWHSFFYSQDDYTAFCQIVLLCSTAGTILLCFDAVRKDRLNAFEFIVLMLLSTCSMLFLISAYDLIAMYLSIELQSLCFYVIAAYNRNSEFATEAGLKYLILGAFASGILLFGCSMIYGSTGGTQFDLLAEMLTGDAMASFGALRSGGIWMGILCLSVGFLFKITAVPFHMWAPDLYEGSPTLVSAFVSIAPKISLFSNLLNTLHRLDGTILQQIFFICSIASMILGALAAMAQTKVKRLLAYSSVGHVGYLCTGYACGTIVGMQSLLIGLFIYVLMTIDAFAIVLALRPACTPTRVKYLADMGAFSGTNPMLAMLFSITIFSYAGIPPLAGFCSKFYLLFAAWGCGLQVLAFLGVFTSVIGRWAAGRCCCCSRYLRRVESTSSPTFERFPSWFNAYSYVRGCMPWFKG